MDMRYLGILLMVVGIFSAYNTYIFSESLLSSIGMTHECDLISTCPHIQIVNQSYLGYAMSAAIFIAGLFIFLRGKAQPAQKKIEKPADLKPDEEIVYNLISESGGMIFQSEIVEKTGFPKARVTRVLDRMEARHIIERRRRGMTNAILLK